MLCKQVKQNKDSSYGYNVQTHFFEDLMKACVIDPTKVVRSALENTSSIYGLILTTECIISEKPKKEEKPATAVIGGVIDNY